MTPRDNVLSSTTSMRSSTGSDPVAERATPKPTVLSTIWEGPTSGDRGRDRRRSEQNPGDEENGRRFRFLRWLLAPATRGRALVITTLAALICAGAVSAVEMFDNPRVSNSPGVQTRIESTQATLASRAVSVDTVADGAATHDPGPSIERDLRQAAMSADDRLRLTAEALVTGSGSWMIEAEITVPADPGPTVVFTVNGVVIEQVDQAPYRLLVNSEIVESRSALVVGPGQPLIVTASARWSTDGDASPATLILAD